MTNDSFINLNELFEKEYQYDKKDFFHQPFIELETMGKRKKFWFLYNNQKYLYKKADSNLYEIYGELLSTIIASKINIPCASYMPAKFDYENEKIDDFKDSVGVITPNFLKEKERLVPIGEVIQQVLKDYVNKDLDRQKLYDVNGLDLKDAIQKMNSLEDLWPIFDIYLEDYPNKHKFVKMLMEELVKIYFFDLITLQGDRHVWNFGIILGPNYTVRMPPIYDNANMCNLNRPKTMLEFSNLTKSKKNYIASKKAKVQKGIFNALYHSKLRLSGNADDFLQRDNADKKKNQLESLQDFLSKSDSETSDLLYNYIVTLKNEGMESIINECEQTYGFTFKKELKEYLVTSMNMNLDNMMNILTNEKGYGR